jgi:hypothetical protein
MNPNESSANKTYNITSLGTTIIPVPSNGNKKLVLIALVINTKGASSNTATVYDSNATIGANAENKKATIDTVNTFGRIEYGIPMYYGIYIAVATGTPADITVIYAETP